MWVNDRGRSFLHHRIGWPLYSVLVPLELTVFLRTGLPINEHTCLHGHVWCTRVFLDAYILRSYNEEGVISECVICLLVARRKSASLLLRNDLPRTCHPQSNHNVLIRPNHSLYGLTTSCLQYTQNANWGVTASPLESLKCDSNQDLWCGVIFETEIFINTFLAKSSLTMSKRYKHR